MNKILKYKLSFEPKQIVRMPFGSIVLSVQNQNGEIVVWVMCNNNSDSNYTFHLVETGKNVPQGLYTGDYIGTTQIDGYVCHIFLTPTI